eukprot:6003861-Prymnesium_polylepis.1
MGLLVACASSTPSTPPAEPPMLPPNTPPVPPLSPGQAVRRTVVQEYVIAGSVASFGAEEQNSFK